MGATAREGSFSISAREEGVGEGGYEGVVELVEGSYRVIASLSGFFYHFLALWPGRCHFSLFWNQSTLRLCLIPIPTASFRVSHCIEYIIVILRPFLIQTYEPVLELSYGRIFGSTYGGIMVSGVGWICSLPEASAVVNNS